MTIKKSVQGPQTDALMSLVAGVLMVLFSMAMAVQMICSLDEKILP